MIVFKVLHSASKFLDDLSFYVELPQCEFDRHASRIKGKEISKFVR